MRLPSGYGQVVKLGGRRRRPYAVRIDEGEKKCPDGHYVRKVRYLEYFENRRDAMDYLARYFSICITSFSSYGGIISPRKNVSRN